MKKVINTLAYILIICGISLLMGTAGGSDMGTISISQILSQVSMAIAMMCLGGAFKLANN